MEEEMSEWQPYALGIQRWYLFHRKYLDLHSHKTHVECTQSPWLSCCLCCPSFYWDPSVDDTPSAIVSADSLNQALRIEDCNGYFQLSQCFLSYKLWRLFYFVFRWSVSKRVLCSVSFQGMESFKYCFNNLNFCLYGWSGKDSLSYQLPHSGATPSSQY